MTGSATLGLHGQSVYVNTATGNLVLQQRDDLLVSTGIDLFAVRTYNSQGTFDPDGSPDNWRLGFYRSIDSLTGTLNTTGSTITRTDADGARAIYRWNGSVYINTEGDGAHDTLSYDAANRQWLWTNGSTRMVETYAWQDGAGKLVSQADSSGNRIDFVYTGNRLTEVRDQSGEKQLLVYSGNNLAEIRTVREDGTAVTRVRYGYDDMNRLATMTVDLSPEDNSIADGKTYVTSYTYDGASTRLASVAETDGTRAQFSYKQIGTMWLVDTLTQVVDGVARTTSYAYGDILNAVPVSANVDSSLLDTIGDQTVEMNPAVDPSKLTTSEVVTTGHNASIDAAHVVSNATTTDNRTSQIYPYALLTTEDAVTSIFAYLQQGAVSTTDPLVADHAQALNAGKLLTTDVQAGTSTAPLDASKLTTQQPVLAAHSASRDDSQLTTADGATYYLVQQGDTWASITAVLYGTQDAEASARLQALLGSPTLATGAKLTTFPATLQYDVVTGQTTVPAFYTIGTDDSWTTITKTLYGTDNADAVQALQQAMGNPSLLAGAHLTKLPTTLQYQKHVTVAPYFLVKAGDTWNSIALALYGSGDPEAGAALQQALSGQTLAPGVKLTGFPSQLIFTTTTIAVPGYYRIQASDTWSSIAQTLYGYSQPEAGVALQQAMGNPVLTPGAKLSPLPSYVYFTVQQVTVPAYYRIQSGDTWQNIAARVYYTSEPAAAEALRLALGNPALTAGAKLTDLPATLSYQVTTPVSPYYLVTGTDTWESIASTLYHTTDPEAALLLQATMGRPTLTAGIHLSYLPATLNYTTSATVILASTYVIKAGDTWAGITQALYGTTDPAAVTALKAALGSPNLTPGAKLSHIPATLSYAVNASNVPVPPYYRVQQGDTLDSITYALYHTHDAEAVAALQTATGNPVLSNGLQLNGVPATLKYVKVPTTGAETRITDALGNLTIVTSDSQGRLTKVVGPQVNGVSQSVTYTYDNAGNMLSQTDAMGNTSTYAYDDAGNQVASRDRLGNTVSRIFTATNQLRAETVQLATPGSYYGLYTSYFTSTTYYIYDTLSRLRFTASSSGIVTEYRYDAAGNQTSVIKYPAQTDTSAYYYSSEADLVNWVNSIGDKSTIERTDYSYDFRGQVSAITAWAKVDAAGNGIKDGSQNVTSLVYDQAGLLLQTIAASGLVTSNTYDGLGRVLATTDNAGAATTAVYDDAGNRVLTTRADGVVSTSVYNEAGQLTSAVRNDAQGNALGETRYWYDALGRLRVTQAPDGSKHVYLYDAAGRMTGEIDASGRLTEYQYNVNGDRTESITYATFVAPLSFMARTLDLGEEGSSDQIDAALHLTLDNIRPAASPTDAKAWSLYDADDRLVWQIDALGYATQTLYDGASQPYATNRLATPIDVALLKDGSDLALKLLGNSTALQLSEAGPSSTAGAHTYVAVISTGGASLAGGTVSFFAGAVLLGSAAVVNNVATFTATNLPAGHSDIIAVYSGDAANKSSTSQVLGADAPQKPASAVMLSADLAGAAFGAPLGLTATVSGANPSGMVAFYSDGAAIGYGAVHDGIATLSLDSLPVGAHNLTAVYLGDAANAGSTSHVFVESVGQARSSVVVTSSDSMTNVGTEVTLTATVGGVRPTGTVTFYDQNGEVLGIGQVVNGVATAVAKNEAAGVTHVVAAYSGDVHNTGSLSSVFDETVDTAVTYTALYANTLDTANGKVTMLTVRITGFNPTGDVSFFGPGNTLLGKATVAGGYAALPLLDAGLQLADVTAVYTGDANNATSVSQRVDSVPNQSTFSYNLYNMGTYRGAGLAVYPNFSGATGGGMLTMLDSDGTILASTALDANMNSPLTIWNTALASGLHNLTLVFSGNASTAPAVATMTMQVDPASTSTALTVSDAYAHVGQDVVYTARITSYYNPAPLGGQIVFRNATTGVVLGTVPVVDGIATLSTEITAPTAGYEYVYAEYQGDSYYAQSTGSAYQYNQVVTDTSRPVATLSASATILQQGAPLTLTAAVATADGANQPNLLDATVFFYNDTVLLGSARTNAAGIATLTTTLEAVGTAHLTAVAARNSGGDPIRSLTSQAVTSPIDVGVTAAATPPTVPVDSRPLAPATLTLDTSVIVTAATVTVDYAMTLTVSMVNGTYIPYGTPVAFYNHGQLIGMGGWYYSSAWLTLGKLPAGDYAFTAVIDGTANLRPSETPATPLTVTTLPTTTTLRVNPVAGGAPNAYRLVADVSGSYLAHGKVSFYNGSQLLGQADLVNGLAVLDDVALPGGAVSIHAEFGGDAVSSASQSTVVNRTIYAVGTTVALSSSAVSAAIGAPLVLSASVTGVDPHGSVSFFDGDTLLGSANLNGGVATLTVADLPLGSRSLRAVYTGDAENALASSNILEQTVARGDGLVLSIDRTSVIGNTPLALTATFGNVAATGTVRFMDGSILLGTATIVDGQAIFAFTPQVSGAHALHAVYDGDGVAPADASAPVTLSVLAEPTTIAMTTATPSVRYGDPVTLTATVTGDHPAGTVTFVSSDGGTVFGTAAVINGVATLTLDRPLWPNTFQILASYSGDARHAASVSLAVAQTITQAPSNLTLTTQVAAVNVGSTVLLSAHLAPNGNSVTNGGVYFYDGDTYVGYAYVQADGIAQVSVSTLAAGTHTLRAVYSNIYGYFTDGAVATATVTVGGPARPTLSLSPSGYIYVPAGQTTTIRATLSGGAAPTGVMTFTAIGGPAGPAYYKVLGTATVVDGVATLELHGNDFGNDFRYIGVSYAGDANNTGAALNYSAYFYPTYVTQSETRTATVTSLGYTTSAGVLGSVVNLNATVGDANAGGTVSFYSADTLLGSAAVVNGQAVLTMAPSTDVFNVTAVYSGDATRAPSTTAAISVTAAQAPTELTVVASTDRYLTNSDAYIYVRVAGPYRDGYAEIFINGVSRGSYYVNSGLASVYMGHDAWSPPGTYDVQARFSAYGSLAVGTSAVAHIVSVTPTTTIVAATPPYPGVGAEVTLTATVSGSNPTGTVTFFDGYTAIGTADVVNGVATFVTRRMTQGYANWNAVYSGDVHNTSSYDKSTYYYNSNNAALATVQPVATATDLAIAVIDGPSGPQQQVTVTITGVKPTGLVTFFDRNGKPLGTASVSQTDLLSQGRAVFVLPAAIDGLGVASATYSGDANNATSVSTSLRVPDAPAQVVVSSSDPLPIQGMPVDLRASIGGTHPGGVVVFFGSDGKELGRASIVDGAAVLTVTSLPSGKNNITVMYAGDADNGFAAVKFVQDVAPSRTSITLAIPAGQAAQGAKVILTATVARPGTGYPTGTVTFYSGATIIGSASLVNGQAALMLNNLPLGANELSVRYGGDADNIASRSEAATQITVAAPMPTATALSTANNYITSGDTVALRATVTTNSGQAPDGIVTFFKNQEVIGTAKVVNGVAVLSVPIYDSYYAYYSASYEGDAANAPSAVDNTLYIYASGGGAAPSPLTTPTSLSFDATPSAVTFGEASTLHVNVQTVDSAHPATGSVIFFYGSNIVGSAPVVDGSATLDFKNFSYGTMQLTAVYSGDQYNAPTSHASGVVRTLTMAPAIINPILTVSRQATGTPRYFLFEATIPYPNSALASQLENNATVEFFIDGRSIGTAYVSNGQAVYQVDPHYVGSGAITAVYHGDGYYGQNVRATGTSAPVAVTVEPEPINVTLSASPSPAVAGNTVSLYASVPYNYSRGYTTAAGTFSFFDGDVLLGSVNATDHPSGAGFTILNVAGGQHEYRAVYSGNPAEEIGVSYSSPLQFNVSRPATGIQATEVAVDANNNVVQWSSYSATNAQVTITVTGNPTPTGTVVLYSSSRGERLGTAQLVGGKAVFMVPANKLADGYHYYNVVYSGDDYNQPVESNYAVFNYAYAYAYSGGIISQYNDSVALSSRPDPLGQAGMVELYANVKGADPTGAITFKDAYGNVLGTSALIDGVARLTVAAPLGGLAGVTASYPGDAYNYARTATYTAPAAVSLGATTTTLLASQDTVALGTSIVLTANVGGANAPVGTVTFYDGATVLGTVAVQNGSAVLATTALSAGVNHLTAVYSGDAAHAASMSAAVDETVFGAAVAVTVNTPAGPVAQGAPATYTATVSGTVPGGLVTFISGTTVLGTAAVVRGVATLTLASNAFEVGTVSIIASYTGDAANNAAISQAVQQTVTAGMRQVTVGASAADRKAWTFSDNDGRVRATIDAEGYVTQYVYDAASRLVAIVRSATQMTSAVMSAISYESNGGAGRIESISSYLYGSVNDQTTYLYYDNMGRKVGEVDAEGYLSEYVYDNANRVTDTIRYATPARAPVSTTSTLSGMRPSASGADQHTKNEYDLHDRLTRQTAADGTVTNYTYDIDGNLTSAVRAAGTSDARATFKRYDALGRLVAELDGVGSALVTGDQSAAEVAAIWAAHGTTYSYDVAGRLTSATAPAGQRTVYFYNDDGQLRFTVNALGEVTENRYDTLGRQTDTFQYAATVTQDSVTAMVGGLLSDSANAAGLAALALAGSADATHNSGTHVQYDLGSNIVQSLDAMGNAVRMTYNAFGEVVTSTQAGTTGGLDVTTIHTYDHRGIETSTVERTDAVYVMSSTQYDAFGRVVRSTDANGNVSQAAYDRLGHVVQTTAANGATRKVTYDAFGRELTVTDARNDTTHYTYDTAARSVTVTTAENVVTTTVTTRNGQVLSVTDGNSNTTSYHYDANGNLLTVVTPDGTATNSYDAANRLVLATDANGTDILYTWDAANRQLTRTVDPAGLDQQTTYAYDAKGQLVRATDPAGIVTATQFDLDGHVLSQTYDADGAPRTTTYAYDQQGQVVRITLPGGVVTDYVYDDLGRRIRTITDPAGLALVEHYEYDASGNVTAKVDPSGNRTRYVYNSVNQLVYTVDALGIVTQSDYNEEGQVARTTVYAAKVNLASLGTNPGTLNVFYALTANSAQDTVTYHVYDKDGRLTDDIDGMGGVTAYRYDGNGNLVSRVTYANRINMGAWTVGTAPALVADATRDIVSRTVYDAMNRPVYTIDGTGAVTAMAYDAVGNLVDTVRYAHPIAVTTPATAADVAAALAPDASADVHMRYRYDNAGRKIWEADSLGQVTGYTYDAAGNVTRTMVYAHAISAQAEPASVVASAGDRVTLMGYDAQNRMTVQVDAGGVVTRRTFDANGNVASVTTYAGKVPVPTAASTIALANEATPDAADHTVRSVFDAANREIYRIDSLGAVTEQQYDGNGNVTARIDYAAPIATSTPATLTDVAAAVAAIADGRHDIRTRNVYDADGLLVWSVQNGRDLTGYTYNNLGELLRRTVYARALGAGQTDFSPAALATAAQAAADGTQDGFTVQVYDKAGQLIWNTDGAGTLTKFTYDTAGNQIAQVVYAQKALGAANAAPGAVPFPTESVNDVRSYQVFDSANRLAWSIDGTGGVTHYTYDGKGQLVETRVYANRIDLAAWTVGTVPPVLANAADALTRTVYDADGRAAFTVDGAGQVVEMRYDADGNVSDRIRYATPVPLATAATAAALTAALGAGSAGDLHERFAYDSTGALLFQADAAGHVTGFTYDAFGNVTKEVSYATTIGAGTALASVQASSGDQVVLSAYDADNRAVMQIDASGQITQRTFDALGNVTQTVVYTNRVTRPTAASASLTVSSMAALVTPDGARDRVALSVFDADQNEIYSIDASGTVTARQFDALGNLVSRTVYCTTVAVPATADAASMAALVAAIADPSRDDTLRYVHDQAGRVLYSIDAAEDVNSYTYTAAGQVMSTRTYLRRATAATPLTASALNALVTTTTPTARFEYVYDAANRLAYEVDAAGSVTRHEYDGEGNEIKRTVYANRINLAQFTSGVAPVMTADALRDSSLRTVYDGLGRPIFTIDRDGYMVALQYDVQGNVAQRVAYARRIDPQTPATAAALAAAVQQIADPALDTRDVSVYGANGRLAWSMTKGGQVIGYTYDAHGNVIKQINFAQTVANGAAPASVIPSAGDQVSLMAYDANDRLVVSVDAHGRVTQFVRDADGNVVQQTVFATLVAAPAASSAPLDVNHVLPARDAAHDRVVRSVYDNLGREIYTIDQSGAVTATRYDGMAVERISYARAIPADTAATASALAAALQQVADATRDRFERSVHDASGSLISTTDAWGDVTRYSYDAAGNQIETMTPEGKAVRQVFDTQGRVLYTVNELGAATGFTYDVYGNAVKQVQYGGTISATFDPAALTGMSTGGDRTSLIAYNQNGQLVYAIDGEGTVRQQQYDGAGNMTALTIYATRVDVASVALGPYGVAGIASRVASTSDDRTSHQVFDSANRLIYSVDPLGFTQKFTYDARGNLAAQTRFATSVLAAGAFATWTVAGLDARVTPDVAHDQTEHFAYNALGLVTQHTDAEGKSETTDYDGMGQKVAFTDKNGSKWTYVYDAAGNQTEETSPEVIGKDGYPVRRIVTMTYDALGQQLARFESGDGSTVVTTYAYDNMGNQVRIDFGQLSGYVPGTMTPVLSDDAVVTMAYNRLGEVVSETDVAGYVSRKVYDEIGQLRYEIDAKGNVTEYTYNNMGQQVFLTRYDGTITVSQSQPTVAIMAAQVAALDQSHRRTIVTLYDLAGRVQQVTQPAAYVNDKDAGIAQTAAAQVRYTYDAFGEVIQVSTATNPVTGTWAIVNNYYDQRGLLQASVDAAGYKTSYSYDSAGNVTGKLESAMAIAGWTGNRLVAANAVPGSSDRITTTAYDRVGRVVRESLTDGSGQVNNEHVRVTEYDAMGNVTATSAWGPGASGAAASTRMFYDALGRMTAIIDSTRPAGNGYALTTYRYIAAGAAELNAMRSDAPATAAPACGRARPLRRDR